MKPILVKAIKILMSTEPSEELVGIPRFLEAMGQLEKAMTPEEWLSFLNLSLFDMLSSIRAGDIIALVKDEVPK